MTIEIGELSDSSRLLFDLQKANAIAQNFLGCLEPKIISRKTAQGLAELFNSAFAHIWLVEPDGSNLKLVASSGLYDRSRTSLTIASDRVLAKYGRPCGLALGQLQTIELKAAQYQKFSSQPKVKVVRFLN